ALPVWRWADGEPGRRMPRRPGPASAAFAEGALGQRRAAGPRRRPPSRRGRCVTAEPIAAPVIAAVTVDLDDTIFPQSAWLEGAWEAVAAAGGTLGLDAAALHERLVAISAAGSDGGRIIDRALVAIGCSEVDLPALTPGLLAAFRAHAPKRLECYPGVVAALASLRAAVPVACITDGDPHI